MENFDDKYKKKNPFTVPDHYFDGLTERVMKRVGEEEKAKKKGFVRFFRPYMGWAAIFVIALIVAQVLHSVVDYQPLLKADKMTGQVAYVPESMEEDIFDSHFNPTSEEIIEYLASEVDNYELMIAGIY